MDAIERRVFAILFMVAIVIAAVVSFKLYFANIALDSANEKVDRLTGEKQLLQSDLTNTTNALENSERANERLRREAQLNVKIMAAREAAKHELEGELANIQQRLAEVINNATDQHTKDWAVDTVPDAINQLLKQRAYCANRSHHQDRVCLPTGTTDQQLPGTAVQRHHEF